MDDNNKPNKPDRFTKFENKGFNFANKMHKFAINGCLIFIGYQLYVFLREYNDFFLNARKIKKMEQFDQDGPINKDLAEWLPNQFIISIMLFIFYISRKNSLN